MIVDKIINHNIRGLVDEGYDMESIKRILDITGVEMRGLTDKEISRRAILAVV